MTSPLMEESILRPQMPKQQAPAHPVYIKGMSHNLTRKNFFSRLGRKKNFSSQVMTHFIFFLILPIFPIDKFHFFFYFLQFLEFMLSL